MPTTTWLTGFASGSSLPEQVHTAMSKIYAVSILEAESQILIYPFHNCASRQSLSLVSRPCARVPPYAFVLFSSSSRGPHPNLPIDIRKNSKMYYFFPYCSFLRFECFDVWYFLLLPIHLRNRIPDPFVSGNRKSNIRGNRRVAPGSLTPRRSRNRT